jgi:chemotaxis protein CheC
VSTNYTDLQLDALRELANIGSGTAATALSSMCGTSIDIDVPRAAALPLVEAIDSCGPPDSEVTGVAVEVLGDMDATVLILFTDDDSAALCGLLGVEPGTEMGLSALGEIGNVLAASYVGALGSLTGLELEPAPPQVVTDMLGAMVGSVLLATAASDDVALLLDSSLKLEGAECSLSFLLVPTSEGVGRLLAGLGVAA